MKRETLAHLILGLTIVLLPFFLRIGPSINGQTIDCSRSVKDNLIIMILVFVCAIFPSKKRSASPIVWVSLCWCLFFASLNHWNVISVNVVIQQFYIGVWACFAVKFYESFDKNRLNYLLNGISIGGILQSILAICDFYNIHLQGAFLERFFDVKWVAFVHGGVGSATGTLGNQNLLGAYLAVSAMSLARKKWKWFLPLPIFGLIAGGSLMGIVSLIGGLIYLNNYKRKWISKKYMYALALIPMAVLWIGGGFGIDSGRVKLWNMSLKNLTVKTALIGNGPGWFPDQGFITGQSGADTFVAGQEHNEYLTIFNMFGIAGIILLFLLMKEFIWSSVESIWTPMLYVSFLNAYGHFSLHQSTLVIIIVITACICIAQGKENVRNLDGI